MENQIALGSNAKKLLIIARKKEMRKKKLKIAKIFCIAFALFAAVSAVQTVFFFQNKAFFEETAKPFFVLPVFTLAAMWVFSFGVISFLVANYIFKKGRIVIIIELFANCLLFLLFPLFFFVLMSPFAAFINIFLLFIHTLFMCRYCYPALKKLSLLFLPVVLILFYFLALNYCIIILN